MTTEQRDQFVAVHTLGDRFEADVLTDALEKEGIPIIMRPFEETPYTGLFVSQRGWGVIMVPRELTSKAKMIIGELHRELKSLVQYVDPSEIDPQLWQRLRDADPDAICKGASVRFENDAYVVPYLGAEFLCRPTEELIEPCDAAPLHSMSFELYLAMIHYLLDSSGREPSGRWVSGKDIPSGETFFRGPHELPVKPVSDLFGKDPELFQLASERLGGRRGDMADTSCILYPFPRVPLHYLLWLGDDEFEASATILFDETISQQLNSLDTIWAMTNAVSRSLCRAGEAIRESGANE